MAHKGPDAFRTISEAVTEVGAPAHVLRFWETKFRCLRPVRRAGGRRFYRPEDIRVLVALRHLLHEQRRPIGDIQRLSRRDLIASIPTKQPGSTRSANNAPHLEGLSHALAAALIAKTHLDELLSHTAT